MDSNFGEIPEDGDGDGDGEEEIAPSKSEEKSLEEEIEEMKRKLEMMEENNKKISSESEKVEKELPIIARNEEDEKSVYVGEVDYTAKPEEIQEFFSECGIIERVTIMTNKFTGQPKGYCYIEFKEKGSVEIALEFDGKEFKGRNLKVRAKRSNVPGMGKRGRRGRGRGRGGRFRGRRRGRRYRGRGRGRYPY